MSTFNFPTLEELVSRIQNDVKTELPQSNPWLPNSWIRSMIIGYAGRFSENYLQLNNVRNSLFIDTSTDDFLDAWGKVYSLPRNPATAASGSITAFGTPGSFIEEGEELTSSDGIVYRTQADAGIEAEAHSVALSFVASIVTAVTVTPHSYASGLNVTISDAVDANYNGTFEINVLNDTTFTYTITGTPAGNDNGTASADIAPIFIVSDEFGEQTNQQAGAQLTFSETVVGVNETALVQIDGITGGEDEESNDDYRQRIKFKVQNPGADNSKNGIEERVKSVNGVTRVWTDPGIGTYTVYFVRDNDDDIIPTVDEINTVRALLIADDYLPRHLPATDVIVKAPTPLEVPFTFSFLAPNTKSMQSAIEATLDLFFRENSNTSTVETGALTIKKVAYDSAIFNTVDPTSGEQVTDFILATPTGDISIPIGSLGVLGAVTFS